VSARTQSNLLVTIFLTLAISGCTTAPRLTGSHRIDASPRIAKAAGSACGLEFLDIIPIGTLSRTQRAYDNAVNDVGARALLAPSISDTRLDLVVGTLRCSQVEGTAIF
jgi:hypothetical protein